MIRMPLARNNNSNDSNSMTVHSTPSSSHSQSSQPSAHPRTTPPPTPGATIQALAVAAAATVSKSIGTTAAEVVAAATGVTNVDNSRSANNGNDIAATVVAMSQALHKSPLPDDSQLVSEAMEVLRKHRCTAYNPAADPTLRIVSMCASSDIAYKAIIPRLLEHYSEEMIDDDDLDINDLENFSNTKDSVATDENDIYAQITHVIPPNKTVTMVQARLEEDLSDPQLQAQQHSPYGFKNYSYKTASSSGQAPDDYFSYQQDSSAASSAFSIMNRSTYMSPQQIKGIMDNPTYNPQVYAHRSSISSSSSPPFASCQYSTSSQHYDPHQHQHQHQHRQQLDRSQQQQQQPFNYHSVHRDLASWNLQDKDRLNYYRNNIYNNFAVVSKNERYSVPAVPPGSAHYVFSVHPIPTHVLPPFATIASTRYKELAKGGLMLLSYPSSQRLHDENVLPCIDLSLHQMLALNMINTSACEAVSLPPVTTDHSRIPDYEDQKMFLEHLPGANMLYASRFDNLDCRDWGYRWLDEEIDWLRSSLSRSGFTSSQVLVKLIEGMTTNKEWHKMGKCDVSVFVVQKC